ncbi:MAG: hypothetical protein ACLFVS_03260 [Candidatus Acetothermia bacterium]
MKKFLIVTLSVSIVLIGFSVLSVAEEKEKQVGNWTVIVEEDPLTDKLTVLLFMNSNQGKEESSVRALYIRLQEGTTDLFLVWKNEVLDKNKILYRFDKGEVKEAVWNMATNKKGLFFPDERKDLESFVERLIKAEKFIVGAKPQGRIRTTDVFELEGLGKALSPYLEEFGWEGLEETIKDEMEGTEE